MNFSFSFVTKFLKSAVFLTILALAVFSGCETKETSPEKDRPTVSTIPTFEVDQFSMTVRGVVSSDGFIDDTKRGICYSKIDRDPQPNKENVGYIEYGNGIGNFSGTIDGLESNTTYYVRAVATNSKGIGLGEVLTIRTTAGPLAKLGDFIVNQDLTNEKQLIFSAIVTGSGGTPVIERGVCWDTKVEPTANATGPNAPKSKAFGEGEGAFDGIITGLTGNTVYSVRPYARNSSGYSYGPEIRISTVGLAISDIQSVEISRLGMNLRGSVGSYGGLSVIEQGFVWGTASTPTLSNSTKILTDNSNNKPTANIDIASLTVGTTYYIRTFVTNSIGTSYSDVRKIVFLPLGVLYKGGFIYFVTNEATPKALVVAEFDLPDSTQWGCMGDTIKGTSSGINSGAANTGRIISGCSEQNIAARRCRSHSVGGSSSWDLPTTGDMEEILRVLAPMGIGNFSLADSYWTSVQVSDSRANAFRLSNGGQIEVAKKTTRMKVRPVKLI
ncbi:MAG TPA: hypothetical protein PKY12_11180 [Catalimonadaceae bacterium]|jgi:hypothetical protein|nr:hypothetical protein [Catalimonadaceae bacterium]